MEFAAKMARAGNMVLSFIATIMILLMLLYGGYSLWDTSMVFRGAFVSDDLLEFKPASNGEENPTLTELQEINEDVRGWLTIDDTHIDYPVVQGADDMEYINTDVFGEFALSGSIFLSCLNSPDFSDHYNLIYGHHMDNGAMFGDVMEFEDEKFFESHQTGTLYLPEETYGITLFAYMEADGYDRLIYRPGRECESMQALLNYLKKSSTQYRDIGVTAEDRIIGMSTCVDAVTNGRAILFGRLEKK